MTKTLFVENTTTVNLTEVVKIDFRGGYSKRLRPIVTINHAFTEAVGQPPLLMLNNKGGCRNKFAAVNTH